MTDVLEFIKKHRIVIIYRGMQPDDCLEISEVLMDAGIRLFEVTMNSPDTARAIELLHTELGEEVEIGAGTVTEVEQVDAASEAGASYIISPNTDVAVVQRTRERGLLSIPGAFSPTEVLSARRAGANMVKVFPINAVGPGYITQLRGPIDTVPFMATGGIELKMVEELFQAGTDAIGINVRLLGADLVDSRDWTALRSKAKEWLKAAGTPVLR